MQEIDKLTPTSGIFYILRLYTTNFATCEIDFNDLLNFVDRCLEKEKQNEAFSLYEHYTEQRLIHDLELLNEEKKCYIKYLDGKITKIHFPYYFVEQIDNAYVKISENYEQAFPQEESLHLTIPLHMVKIINIHTDFLDFLAIKNPGAFQIIRLLFPDRINPVLTTSDLIKNTLLDHAVMKIRIYLEKKKNASYIENKIYPAFRQQSRSLKDMITNIGIRSSQTVSSIKEPTDFSFRFWAHFTNLIIQEFKQKNELLPAEHDYCQAAYLIYYYNVHYKEIQQRKRDREQALSHFERKIKNAPYVFKLTDIYNFTDNHGYLLLKKCSREYINKIIEEKVQPADPTSLPEIIRFITSHGEDYYIHKSTVMPYCLKRIFEVSREVRKDYINQWIDLMREHRKSPLMTDEIKFIRDLNDKVQLNYPVLAALLNNYYLLYLANAEFPPRGTSTSHLFDRTAKSLQPINILLGLDRTEMVEEARSYLPFWQTIPFLHWMITFFRKLFFGSGNRSPREKEKTTSKVNAKYSETPARGQDQFSGISEYSQLDRLTGPESGTNRTLIPRMRADYKKAIVSLKKHFVGANETIHSRLEFLAEKWNPLYDPVAKANLVEDVNAMIRDYLRSMKRGFRVKPPDKQRVINLASTLAANKHFEEIKKKHYLMQYIEIYIVKELGENRF